MRIHPLFSILALAVATMSGCSKSTPEETVEIGTYSNGVYENRYFGVRVPMPTGWYALNDEQRKKMMQLGTKVITGDDKNFEARLNASQIRSISMFSYFELPPGASPGKFNPSILGIAEDLDTSPGVKTGENYLEHVRMLLKNSKGATFTIDPGYGKETLSGKPFDFMTVHINASQHKVTQKYFSRFDSRKKYMVSFIISYANDDQKKLVEQALAKIELTK